MQFTENMQMANGLAFRAVTIQKEMSGCFFLKLFRYLMLNLKGP